MTKKEFLKAISNAKADIVRSFLDALSRSNVDYCLVDGFAVNAYAEPVISLDLGADLKEDGPGSCDKKQRKSEKKALKCLEPEKRLE